jgi:hypothetical protein
VYVRPKGVGTLSENRSLFVNADDICLMPARGYPSKLKRKWEMGSKTVVASSAKQPKLQIRSEAELLRSRICGLRPGV